MIIDLTREFLARLHERLDKDVRENGTGAAKDWSDYKMRVGVARGMKMAEAIYRDTVRDYYGNDDLEE